MPYDDLPGRSALEIAALVRAGDVSAVEVARAHLALVERDNPALNALVRVEPEVVLAEAARVDVRLPLAGVPFVVKDNIAVAEQVTAAGSTAHTGRPEPTDAPVVARLRAA
ncbi:MAG: hypothetical protein JWO46_3151, partial [Nocardioidaceae bacterium]|nr:hypothetical protein [Nocardioidaceae bacterium]